MSAETANPLEHDTALRQGVDVSFLVGESYMLAIRDHEVLVDQPAEGGGYDLAPTPTELFVASLAACVAFYAGRYLTRHRLCRNGLRVRADFDMSSDPSTRVAAVRLCVSAPTLPPERRAALLAVVSHCTVHNTLEHPPRVDIELD